MKRSTNTGAVLSGDLVLSEELSAAVRSAVPARLRDAVADLADRIPAEISDIDLFRGDSWQLIVEDPSFSLHAALFIRLSLITWRPEVDTRAVIGIGSIESRGDGRVSEGYGEAFTSSGRGLDSLPRDRRISIVDEVDVLAAGVHLLDRISSDWTTSQARAVLMAMKGMSQEEIGAAWDGGPISQQAVAQHLQRASWHAVNHWLSAFSAHFQQKYD